MYHHTVDYVKSFLEWMSDSIAKSFEHTRDNAFLLKHVTLLINKSELENIPDGPKIVLASMSSLEVGFSHDIFVEWPADLKNLILFTERGQFGTRACMLQADPPPKAVKVTMSKRVPLVGEELAAYEEEQNRIKKEEALKATLVKEDGGKATAGADLTLADPMVIDGHVQPDAAGLRGDAYRDILIDGFVPPSSSVTPMFRFYDNTSEWDDFGEVINPDDYVIKEEDMGQASMPLGDYEVAWIDAEVGKTESGMLPSLPLSTPAPPHKSVLVGDIKMADFKQFLAGKGIQVEFAGRALRWEICHIEESW